MAGTYSLASIRAKRELRCKMNMHQLIVKSGNSTSLIAPIASASELLRFTHKSLFASLDANAMPLSVHTVTTPPSTYPYHSLASVPTRWT